MSNKFIKALVFTLLPLFAQASDLQTDWIQPVEGNQEATLGASVRSVETDEGGDSKVTIAIPKPSIGDSTEIEEVVVVGKSPDEQEKKLEIRHEWLDNYEDDNYGLVLYLGKNGDIPLRLYLKAQD